jgi:hypothetical protein
MNIAMDKQPGSRAARLALKSEIHAVDDPVDGLVDVRVWKHDDGVLAATFQAYRLDTDTGRAGLN